MRLVHCHIFTLLHCAPGTLSHCYVGGDDDYNSDDDANAAKNDGEDNDDCDGDDYDDSSPKESFTAFTDVSIKMFSTGLVPTDGTGGLHHHNHHIALPSEKIKLQKHYNIHWEEIYLKKGQNKDLPKL